MWICPKCHTENRIDAAACENCGAVRAAGRFGSAPVRRDGAAAPRIRQASAPGTEQPPVYRPASAREQYRPPDTELKPSKPSRSFLSGLTGGIGGLLAVLPPILICLFAWRQYDALSRAVLPLLLGEDASAALSIACYVALTALAALLCALPGLWTLLLRRCADGLRRDRR